MRCVTYMRRVRRGKCEVNKEEGVRSRARNVESEVREVRELREAEGTRQEVASGRQESQCDRRQVTGGRRKAAGLIREG